VAVSKSVSTTGGAAQGLAKAMMPVPDPHPDAFDVAELRLVTKREPTKNEMNDLIFAFRVAKFVKSNAIVFCANGMTLGVGAGQMSRIDSAKIAAIKAAAAGLSLQGSAAASDAFFPFRDGLDAVADAGATAVVFMWVPLEGSARTPAHLRHRVFTADDSVEGPVVGLRSDLRVLGSHEDELAEAA